jgi:hypothetical protein
VTGDIDTDYLDRLSTTRSDEARAVIGAFSR